MGILPIFCLSFLATIVSNLHIKIPPAFNFSLTASKNLFINLNSFTGLRFIIALI